jgi:hypothetical protein
MAFIWPSSPLRMIGAGSPGQGRQVSGAIAGEVDAEQASDRIDILV